MTKKVYRTAQGKVVDLGALQLQNENVRAVGNMNVNARGDTLDSTNNVIERKTRQVQRQYQKLSTNEIPVTTSSSFARKQQEQEIAIEETETIIEEPSPVAEEAIRTPKIPAGGLAAAIARSKEVKQELEKTARERAQELNTGLKKI